MKKNFTVPIALGLGLILIVWAIMSDGKITSYLHLPSLIITVVGSFCALLMSFPLDQIKRLPSVLKKLVVEDETDKGALIARIVELSRISRSQGLLALDNQVAEIGNEFLADSIKMVIDGMDPENIREILETKIDNMEARHSVGQNIFLKWGELAPGFGMLGTIIGLINMLGSLTDPNAIGGGMAVALVTTFYGSLMANLIFMPIAQNLQSRTQVEATVSEMVMEGVLAIQSGQNPRVIEQKLESYLDGIASKERPEPLLEPSEGNSYV